MAYVFTYHTLHCIDKTTKLTVCAICAILLLEIALTYFPLESWVFKLSENMIQDAKQRYYFLDLFQSWSILLWSQCGKHVKDVGLSTWYHRLNTYCLELNIQNWKQITFDINEYVSCFQKQYIWLYQILYSHILYMFQQWYFIIFVYIPDRAISTCTTCSCNKHYVASTSPNLVGGHLW